MAVFNIDRNEFHREMMQIHYERMAKDQSYAARIRKWEAEYDAIFNKLREELGRKTKSESASCNLA